MQAAKQHFEPNEEKPEPLPECKNVISLLGMEDAPSTPNVETEFDPCDQDLLVLTNEEIESVSKVGEKAADIEKAIKLISTIVHIQARQPAEIF